MPDRLVSPLSVRLFGPFEVQLHGHPLPRLRTRKGQWLLSLLILRAGAEVQRAWLAGTLWPDSPEAQALNSLRQSLNDLRRALGSEAARLSSPSPYSLSLDLSGTEVDVHAFDAAIRHGDDDALETVVGLYGGPLLEGWTEEWVFQERQVREEAYLQALESLAAHALAREEPAVAERYLRRAVGVDPLRESAQRGLMQALATDGNFAAALLAYRELRLVLHRELNTGPDPATTALYQQLRGEARRKAALGAKRGTQSNDGGVTGDAGTGPVPRAPRRELPEGTVTFLFTDIEGSARLWEAHPEAMREALGRHEALLRWALQGYGGHVFKTVGDQFCAAFATAHDALEAAWAAQRALHTEPWEELAVPRVRMALHTGTAEAREGDYFGPTLSRVARLLEAGHGGQILLSQTTYDLVRDDLPEGADLSALGEHRFKNLVRPEHAFQLLAADLPSEFPPLRTLDARPNNLPVQPTPLLGREEERSAVRELLQSELVRLVTLTGAGGTGKTRLALQVAADMLNTFQDGVFFVALAPIREPELLASAIAPVLGIREMDSRPLRESLKAALLEKQMLLLLDNFEQVVEAAPLVAELRESCPRLKLLVTSRAPLHLRGEKEFLVPPLALPDLKHLPPAETLSQYAAVELFIQRALDVKPDFVVTNQNAPAVAEICHRLDGLPLAIELAAARVKLFTPEALLSRLGSRLKLLTGGARDLPERQKTLRGAIAWSYDLLAAGEKALYRRLAIFAGGCTLEAAEAVCDAEGDLEIGVLDGVTSLVDRNMLRQEEGVQGEPRLQMLETLREYGTEQLTAAERETMGRQHAAFYLALAERAAPELVGAAQEVWLERLEREHDNLRAALAWSAARPDAEAGLRLGGPLSRFWERRGYLGEGRERLAGLLALPGAEARTAVRAKALNGEGALAYCQGDYEAARALHEESLVIYRELGDKQGIAFSLNYLGLVVQELGDYEAAWALHEESLAIHQELGDKQDTAWPLNSLGLVAWKQGDYGAARAFHEEGLGIFRELGDRLGIAKSLNNLANLASAQGDYGVARTLYEESLGIFRELGDKLNIAASLNNLGTIAEFQGDYGAARALHEESLVIKREIGDRQGIAMSLYNLGGLDFVRGDCAAAQARLSESLRIFREVGDKRSIAVSLDNLGLVAQAQQDYGAARALYQESLGVSQELGDRRYIAMSLNNLGSVVQAQGDYGAARAFCEESLVIRRELGHKLGMAESLRSFAALAVVEDQPERAARLLGAAAALREAIGAPLPPAERADEERHIGTTRTALGEEAFAAAWGEGCAMAVELAVAYALEDRWRGSP